MIRIIGTGVEGRSENQFAQPRGICYDSRRNEIYVCDCNNHRIQVFNSKSLAFLRQIGKGVQGTATTHLNYAVGICLDPEGNELFVADTNNHRILVFDQIKGESKRILGSQGNGIGQLSSPYGVCLDKSKGHLFIADYDNHRISVFDKNTGEVLRIIGLGYGSGPGQLNQPIVSCVDEETNNLFVADYSNNRVQVFHKDSGKFIRLIGGSVAGMESMNGPRGLCLDYASGLLFVADRENHRIHVYMKSTFTFLRFIGIPGTTAPGMFYRPMEMCVNPEEGVLLVVDGYNHRVQVIEVPELQAERAKASAKAKEKVSAEAKALLQPKASIIAVSTQLSCGEIVSLMKVPMEDSSGEKISLFLSFANLGSMYDLELTADEVDFVKTLLPYGNSSLRTATHGFHNDHASCQDRDDGVDKVQSLQAQSILGMIAQIDSSFDSPSHLVPLILALRAMQKRRWKPDALPAAVTWSLVRILGAVQSLAVDEIEKEGLVDGAVSILNSHMQETALKLSADSCNDVFRVALVGLLGLGRLEMGPLAARTEVCGAAASVIDGTRHIATPQQSSVLRFDPPVESTSQHPAAGVLSNGLSVGLSQPASLDSPRLSRSLEDLALSSERSPLRNYSGVIFLEVPSTPPPPSPMTSRSGVYPRSDQNTSEQITFTTTSAANDLSLSESSASSSPSESSTPTGSPPVSPDRNTEVATASSGVLQLLNLPSVTLNGISAVTSSVDRLAMIAHIHLISSALTIQSKTLIALSQRQSGQPNPCWQSSQSSLGLQTQTQSHSQSPPHSGGPSQQSPRNNGGRIFHTRPQQFLSHGFSGASKGMFGGSAGSLLPTTPSRGKDKERDVESVRSHHAVAGGGSSGYNSAAAIDSKSADCVDMANLLFGPEFVAFISAPLVAPAVSTTPAVLVFAAADTTGPSLTRVVAADSESISSSNNNSSSNSNLDWRAVGSRRREVKAADAMIAVPPALGGILGTVQELLQLRLKLASRTNLAQFAPSRQSPSQQNGSSEGIVDGVGSKAEGRVVEAQHGLPPDNRSLVHLRTQLLMQASQYFVEIESHSSDALEKLVPKERGGRNIWRPPETLAVGDLVDAMDKEKSWFESFVVDINIKDGSAKVHFMGWGSKWDDIIPAAELSARVQPLNTMTKDWRADLFEGCLIEVKCNDDPVNQKWMWGRVINLNVEEEWLDVSYQFSLEPTVVKRADLYGETICPVGMHTKDKSKGAAEGIKRPEKKLVDILSAKTKLSSSEIEAFLDSEDAISAEDLEAMEAARGCNDFDSSLHWTGDRLLPAACLGGTMHPASSSPERRGTPKVSDSSASSRASTPGRSTPSGGVGGGSFPSPRRGSPVVGGGATAGEATAAAAEGSAAAMRADRRGVTVPVLNSLVNISAVVFESIMASVIFGVTNAAPGSKFIAQCTRSISTKSCKPTGDNFGAAGAGDESKDDTSNQGRERRRSGTAAVDEARSGSGEDGDADDEAAEKIDPLFEAAASVLVRLARSPYRRLVVPYFCRVLTVQAGLRAKILAQKFLVTYSEFGSSSGITLDEICTSFVSLEAICTSYSALLVRCLGADLPTVVLRTAVLRIKATVSACGHRPIARHAMLHLLRSGAAIAIPSRLPAPPPGHDGLLLRLPAEAGGLLSAVAVRNLLVDDRFSAAASLTRRVLQQLIDVATQSEVDAVRDLWIRVVAAWVTEACENVAAAEAGKGTRPRGSTAFDAKSFQVGVSTVGSIGAAVDASAAAGGPPAAGGPGGLLNMLMDMLQKAREVARMELHNSALFYMASDYAFMSAVALLPRSILDQLLVAIAVELSRLMDPCRDDDDCLFGRAAVIAKERLVDFIQTIAVEPLFSSFMRLYERLLARRLLRGRFASLASERDLLERLLRPSGGDSLGYGFSSSDCMQGVGVAGALAMIADVERADFLMHDFYRFVVSMLDSDQLDYSRDMNFCLQASGFTVVTLASSSTIWPRLRMPAAAQSLKLPSQLELARHAFEMYFQSSLNVDYTDLQGSPKQKRTLHWCLGQGSVTLLCRLNDNSTLELIVNEAQTAVLFAFDGGPAVERSISELATITGMSAAQVTQVVESLSHPLQQVLEEAAVPLETDAKAEADLDGLSVTTDTHTRNYKEVCKYRLADSFLSGALDRCGDDTFTTSVVIRPGNEVGWTSEDDVERMKWRESSLDSLIVRLLKDLARSRKGTFVAFSGKLQPTAISPEDLFSQLKTKIADNAGLKDTFSFPPTSREVTLRCNELCARGIIDATTGTPASFASIGYSYVPDEAESAPKSPSARVGSGSPQRARTQIQQPQMQQPQSLSQRMQSKRLFRFSRGWPSHFPHAMMRVHAGSGSGSDALRAAYPAQQLRYADSIFDRLVAFLYPVSNKPDFVHATKSKPSANDDATSVGWGSLVAYGSTTEEQQQQQQLQQQQSVGRIVVISSTTFDESDDAPASDDSMGIEHKESTCDERDEKPAWDGSAEQRERGAHGGHIDDDTAGNGHIFATPDRLSKAEFIEAFTLSVCSIGCDPRVLRSQGLTQRQAQQLPYHERASDAAATSAEWPVRPGAGGHLLGGPRDARYAEVPAEVNICDVFLIDAARDTGGTGRTWPDQVEDSEAGKAAFLGGVGFELTVALKEALVRALATAVEQLTHISRQNMISIARNQDYFVDGFIDQGNNDDEEDYADVLGSIDGMQEWSHEKAKKVSRDPLLKRWEVVLSGALQQLLNSASASSDLLKRAFLLLPQPTIAAALENFVSLSVQRKKPSDNSDVTATLEALTTRVHAVWESCQRFRCSALKELLLDPAEIINQPVKSHPSDDDVCVDLNFREFILLVYVVDRRCRVRDGLDSISSTAASSASHRAAATQRTAFQMSQSHSSPLSGENSLSQPIAGRMSSLPSRSAAPSGASESLLLQQHASALSSFSRLLDHMTEGDKEFESYLSVDLFPHRGQPADEAAARGSPSSSPSIRATSRSAASSPSSSPSSRVSDRRKNRIRGSRYAGPSFDSKGSSGDSHGSTQKPRLSQYAATASGLSPSGSTARDTAAGRALKRNFDFTFPALQSPSDSGSDVGQLPSPSRKGAQVPSSAVSMETEEEFEHATETGSRLTADPWDEQIAFNPALQVPANFLDTEALESLLEPVTMEIAGGILVNGSVDMKSSVLSQDLTGSTLYTSASGSEDVGSLLGRFAALVESLDQSLCSRLQVSSAEGATASSRLTAAVLVEMLDGLSPGGFDGDCKDGGQVRPSDDVSLQRQNLFLMSYSKMVKATFDAVDKDWDGFIAKTDMDIDLNGAGGSSGWMQMQPAEQARGVHSPLSLGSDNPKGGSWRAPQATSGDAGTGFSLVVLRDFDALVVAYEAREFNSQLDQSMETDSHQSELLEERLGAHEQHLCAVVDSLIAALKPTAATGSGAAAFAGAGVRNQSAAPAAHAVADEADVALMSERLFLLELLAQFGWHPDEVIAQMNAMTTISPVLGAGTAQKYSSTFFCWADSAGRASDPDVKSAGSTIRDGGTLVCSGCGEQAAAAGTFALRCCHWVCTRCWQQAIYAAVSAELLPQNKGGPSAAARTTGCLCPYFGGCTSEAPASLVARVCGGAGLRALYCAQIRVNVKRQQNTQKFFGVESLKVMDIESVTAPRLSQLHPSHEFLSRRKAQGLLGERRSAPDYATQPVTSDPSEPCPARWYCALCGLQYHAPVSCQMMDAWIAEVALRANSAGASGLVDEPPVEHKPINGNAFQHFSTIVVAIATAMPAPSVDGATATMAPQPATSEWQLSHKLFDLFMQAHDFCRVCQTGCLGAAALIGAGRGGGAGPVRCATGMQAAVLRAKVECLELFSEVFLLLAHVHVALYCNSLPHDKDGNPIAAMAATAGSTVGATSFMAETGYSERGADQQAHLMFLRTLLWDECSSAGAQKLLLSLVRDPGAIPGLGLGAGALMAAAVPTSTVLSKLRLCVKAFPSFLLRVPSELLFAPPMRHLNGRKASGVEYDSISSVADEFEAIMAGDPASRSVLWSAAAVGETKLGKSQGWSGAWLQRPLVHREIETLLAAAGDLHRLSLQQQQQFRPGLPGRSADSSLPSFPLFPSGGDAVHIDRGAFFEANTKASQLRQQQPPPPPRAAVRHLLMRIAEIAARVVKSAPSSTGAADMRATAIVASASAPKSQQVVRGLCVDILAIIGRHIDDETVCAAAGMALLPISALKPNLLDGLSAAGVASWLQTLGRVLRAHLGEAEIVGPYLAVLFPLTQYLSRNSAVGGSSVVSDEVLSTSITLVDLLRRNLLNAMICEDAMQSLGYLCVDNGTVRSCTANAGLGSLLVQVIRQHSAVFAANMVAVSLCASLAASDSCTRSELGAAGICEAICESLLYRLEHLQHTRATEIYAVSCCWALGCLLRDGDERMHGRFTHARGAVLVVLCLSLGVFSDALRYISLSLLIECSRVNHGGMKEKLINLDAVILLYDTLRYAESNSRVRTTMLPMVAAAISLLRPSSLSS